MSIRPYAGEAKRDRELTIGPVGPWGAVVTVDAVALERGRHTLVPADTVFEVAVSWSGPPAVGFPPSPRPVEARDVHPVHDHELARALAHRAAEAFQRGGDHPPDLRDLSRELQAFLRSTDPRHAQPAE